MKPVPDLRAVLHLRRIIATFKPDILHAHSSKAGAIARLARLSSWRAPPVLYSPHALSIDLGRRYLAIERVLAHATRTFVAVSESEREDIIRFGLASRSNVRVIPPTIDISRFAPRDRSSARRELGLGGNHIIAAIGRFVPQKDPLGFLRLLERVRRTRPDVSGLLIGDGELSGAVLAEMRRAGLEGALAMPGWVADVRPYVAAADVIVSTARFESFGYATAEALAMAIPVVATRVTGTVDVLGRKSEWMFPYGDWEAGAILAGRLLDDPELRARSGYAGRERVSAQFERLLMTKSLERLYGEIMPVAHRTQ
ncbi:MAG: glycosyltransferase [Candidatus Eremiobacteraeota bacterium]|nr:glycosyltransferase [Candidatus Eremiobacteraeota bacterium]MBC5801676.1 glycosyltransferase [Candidatus Eremiobacteraeota bacterium]MBC5824042.1 glycosyltransferase [Candidatus Eremiobacteraeota bacterium]